MGTVCVYCGSSPGADPAFLDAARVVGKSIAEHGHRLVYGGGHVGLMGAVADAALENGGEVVGVITRHLMDKEVGHSELSELVVVESMHERKHKMAELSDAFLALPGGMGTLEEIVEVFVWSQLGIHLKPCALLNVQDYYQNLVTFLDHMTESRFLHRGQREQLTVETEPELVIEKLMAMEIEEIDKWMDR